ncbi:MAG: hypothetical protein U0M47_01530 [Merdibacter sp.]|nr:hypothetical protein [Merdibacter sp.]
MSNRKRLKKLILANKETRCLYRMMQLLAIFMIVSCLVIIATAKWIEYDQNKKREEIFGSWDEVFLNVDQDDLNYFRKNAFLEQISVQSIQEKVFLEGDQRVVVGACDDNFLEMGNIELLEGRMPEQKKEVAVEEEYLEILGVSKIGDVVSNESEVGLLFGYKVVGVVENYSRMWQKVHPSIKYINCFVSNEHSNEDMVFVKYKKTAVSDLEINMIYYEKNISKINIDLKSIMIRFIVTVSVIEIYLLIRIMKNIKVKFSVDSLFFKRKNMMILKNVLFITFEILSMLFLLYSICKIKFTYIDVNDCIQDYFVLIDDSFISSNVYNYFINADNFVEYKINFLFAVVQFFDKIIDFNWVIINMGLVIFIVYYKFLQKVQLQHELVYNSNYFGKRNNILIKELIILTSVYLFSLIFILFSVVDLYGFINEKAKLDAILGYFVVTTIVMVLVMIVIIYLYRKNHKMIRNNSYM